MTDKVLPPDRTFLFGDCMVCVRHMAADRAKVTLAQVDDSGPSTSMVTLILTEADAFELARAILRIADSVRVKPTRMEARRAGAAAAEREREAAAQAHNDRAWAENDALLRSRAQD